MPVPARARLERRRRAGSTRVRSYSVPEDEAVMISLKSTLNEVGRLRENLIVHKLLVHEVPRKLECVFRLLEGLEPPEARPKGGREVGRGSRALGRGLLLFDCLFRANVFRLLEGLEPTEARPKGGREVGRGSRALGHGMYDNLELLSVGIFIRWNSDCHAEQWPSRPRWMIFAVSIVRPCALRGIDVDNETEELRSGAVGVVGRGAGKNVGRRETVPGKCQAQGYKE
ncbi:hypothetical protein DFH06DRAFT_1296987 [Mycena polygramma]|nr:hypothetical protein DFH06DRAFT_1296987 [Mycena polygramma]